MLSSSGSGCWVLAGAQDLDDRSRAIARKEDVHADLSFFDLVKQR